MRLILLILVALSLSGAEYWVSPTGDDGNAGTFAAPWAITSIFSTTTSSYPSKLSAGDTVYLMPGSYAGGWYSCIPGESANRITIKALPGVVFVPTTSTITSMISVYGDYTDFIGFQFIGGNTNRYADIAGSSNPKPLQSAIYVRGAASCGDSVATGNRVINAFTTGVYESVTNASTSDQDTTIYGSISVADGVVAPDRRHGGGTYVQNATGTETIKHSIAALGSHHDLRLYGTSASVKNVMVDGLINITAADQGGDTKIITEGPEFDNVTIQNSFLTAWLPGAGSYLVMNANYPSGGGTAKDLSFINNDFVSLAATIRLGEGSLVFRGNKVYPRYSSASENTNSLGDPYALDLTSSAVQAFTAATGNTYYTGQSSRCTKIGATLYTSTNWADYQTATGETGDCLATTPTSNWVRTYANEFESGRAHVAIYNWEGATAQSIDPSSFLAAGDYYEIIDVLDPFSVRQSGVYTSGNISIGLTNLAVYEAGNPATPTNCWVKAGGGACSDCYSVWKSGATTGEFGTGAYTYEPAILTTTKRVYYWSGSTWTSTGVNCADGAIPSPFYRRSDTKAFAFLIRRVYDSRQYTSVAWRGDTTGLRAGYRKADGSYSWELPVIGAACVDGLCSARVPQAVGDAWIEVGGAVYKMAAR